MKEYNGNIFDKVEEDIMEKHRNKVKAGRGKTYGYIDIFRKNGYNMSKIIYLFRKF